MLANDTSLKDKLEFNTEYFKKGMHASGFDIIDGDSAILKFRYFDFLKADNCELSKHTVSEDLDLIKLNNCNGTEVKIESVSSFKRLIG